MGIKIKRVYEVAAASDGYRILVDRIWPRGLTIQTKKVRQGQVLFNAFSVRLILLLWRNFPYYKGRVSHQDVEARKTGSVLTL